MTISSRNLHTSFVLLEGYVHSSEHCSENFSAGKHEMYTMTQ